MAELGPAVSEGVFDIATLSEVLLAIYGDTLSRDTWTRVLCTLGQMLSCDMATAAFANVQTRQLETLVVWNFPPDVLPWYEAKRDVIQELTTLAFEKGLTVWTPLDVIDRPEGRIYEALVEMQKRWDTHVPVCVMCGSPPHPVARLWFVRKASREDIGEDELRVLRLLQPHISQALHLARVGIEKDTYQKAFEHLPRSSVICDSSGRILRMNAACEDLIRDGHGDDRGLPLGLEAAIMEMVERQVEVRNAEIAGRRCRLSAVPVQPAHSPTFYVVSLEFTDRLLDLLRIAMLDYGLSRREAEICIVVAQGLSNREIANRLFIVRSRSKDTLPGSSRSSMSPPGVP